MNTKPQSATARTNSHPNAPRYIRVKMGGRQLTLFSEEYTRVQLCGNVTNAHHTPFWINAHDLNERLGWNKYQLRRARKNGTVNYRRDELNELWYDIKSIPLEYFKNKAS